MKKSQSAVSLDVQRRPLKTVVQFALLSLVVLLAGGLTFLWQVQQHSQRSQASTALGSGVVGAPTLPAATVDHIFAQMGSPMVGTGAVVAQAARKANIDDAFALGVWWTETNDGAAGVGSADRNPGSVRGSVGYPSAFDGYTIYPSYAAAIDDWFNVLRNRYISRGLTTVYAISGPYVGTSSSGLWAGKVTALMYKYRGEAPPMPTPIPTPMTLKGKMAAALRNAPHTKAHQSDKGLVQDTMLPASRRVQSFSPAQPLALTQQGSGLPTLSRTTELLIIGFGLLLALAIALIGHRVGRKRSALASAPVATKVVREPVTAPFARGQLSFAPFSPITPTPRVDTEALMPLPVLPGGFASLPPREQETGGIMRRVVLLPSRPVAPEDEPARVPVAAGGRPAGLLSRYSNSE